MCTTAHLTFTVAIVTIFAIECLLVVPFLWDSWCWWLALKIKPSACAPLSVLSSPVIAPMSTLWPSSSPHAFVIIYFPIRILSCLYFCILFFLAIFDAELLQRRYVLCWICWLVFIYIFQMARRSLRIYVTEKSINVYDGKRRSVKSQRGMLSWAIFWKQLMRL